MATIDISGRRAIYARLGRRNRLIAALRLIVPILGAVTLVALVGQIYISSLIGRYSIGQVSVSPDAVSVEAPDYAGTLTDGSRYRVSALEARAALTNTDLVALTNANVHVDRPDGVWRKASAAHAELDGVNQQILIPDLAEIGDSTGTTGRLLDSVVDWASQTLTSRGLVEIDYADGSTVRAEGLVHDADKRTWTFSRAVVTMPSTPGEKLP